MRLTQVQAVQQPVQGRSTDLQDLRLGLRPTKSILLQAFQPQAKSVAVPVKDFHPILVPITEGEQTTGKKVELKMFLNEQRQTIDRFTHVRCTYC